ncbi:hypothetical protein GCM10027059_23330 [Myceligenerans halotolerans]
MSTASTERTGRSYSTSYVVEQSPEAVYAAVLDVGAWWTGSDIVFDIAPTADGTELRFTHVGLVPDVECFDACSTAWLHFIDGSLRSLISTGEGLPDPFDG